MGPNSRFPKPALLDILTLCFGIIFLFRSTAFASPLAGNPLFSKALEKRYDQSNIAPKDGTTGPGTSDYPSDDDINAAFIAPAGAFVFFSGLPNPQTNQAPYQFSQTLPGAAILRNAFPKSYINQRFKPNPERSSEWYQNYLDRVSGVFADKAVAAGNTVYFVGQFDGSVLDCSIWKRVELPTLLAGGIEIKLVDYSNFANVKDYFSTPDSIFARDMDGTLEERATGYCFDWPGDGDDANDPDADPPVGTPYYPGACGLHLQQYQKNEGDPASNGNLGTSDYRITVLLKDANQELVGEVDYFDAPSGQGADIDSELPLVMVVTTGNVDDDPVSFAYGGQSWDSNSGQCSVGGYDSGSRQMDCGFTC